MPTNSAIPVVKNGKFYHVYNHGKPGERWVFVRDAAPVLAAKQTGKPVASAASAALPKDAPAASAEQPKQEQPTRVDPFLSGADIADRADFTYKDGRDRADLAQSISDLAATTRRDIASVDDRALRGRTDVVDAMIARGLFRSSIKDGAVDDIQKQRTAQAGQLQERLRTATIDAGEKEKALNDRKQSFNYAEAVKMAENARTINDRLADNTPAPPATPATSSGGPAALTPPAGRPNAAQQAFLANQSQQTARAEQAEQVSQASSYANKVKNGKFYRVYDAGKPNERWVYVRPASK